ncbi:asparagine synthase (glutamine-hydrolyzing) [Candidatus Woesebacteria bacterium]|nr:asparagine synthase (glutamine-hydrolyzing) [Candidatus Woesebacteria bacterium]
MCGIAGKINFRNRAVTTSELSLMAKKIAHRGPDDEGIYTSPDKMVGLANRRLSIIDLTRSGHQPMGYKNRYWITFNGEIYNFQSEREALEKKGYRFKSRTDTEVILALYDKYGKGCLTHLRGMFAFAIYDDHKKTLFLAKDRIGKKPLKYFWNSEVFIFASELKAILTQKEVKRTPDWLAIHNYLTYGYVPPPATGFQGINKLEPGHYIFLDLKRQKFEKRRFWQPDFTHKLGLSEKEWGVKILDTLKEATKLRMIADVPIGAFLSGGVDSSAVVATMAQLSNKPIKTFTIGFRDKHYSEAKYAKKISDLYKTDHQELTAEEEDVENLPDLVYQYEEPYADSSNIVTHMVSKLARKHVKVVLNGDGGDENFAGYDRYCRLKRDVFFDSFGGPLRPIGIPLSDLLYSTTRLELFKKTNKFLKKSQIPLGDRFTTYICYFKNEDKLHLYSQMFKGLIGDSDSYAIMREKFQNARAQDARDRGLWADLTMYLPEDLLAKVDIASMSVGLEARSPFLDHQMIELASQIPYGLKVKGACQFKYILKKAVEEIIPKENIYRPKMGFTIPLSKWFGGNLNKYAKSRLLSKRAKMRGIFEPSFVKQMLASHTEGNDFGPPLWALLSLELWFEQYFD